MSETTSSAEPIEVPTPIYEPNHGPIDDIDENDPHQSEIHEPFGSEAEREKKSTDKKPATKVGHVALSVLCLALQILVFILAVIATPLDVLRNKNPRSYLLDSRQRACYSLWGYKRCGPHRNHKTFTAGVETNSGDSSFSSFSAFSPVPSSMDFSLPVSGYLCSGYKTRLRAASAFAIVGIAASLVALVLVVLALCKLVKGFVAGILALLAMVFLLVCWACVCATYYKSCEWRYTGPGLIVVSRDNASTMKSRYHFGAGFAILVAAWGLELINAILLFFI